MTFNLRDLAVRGKDNGSAAGPRPPRRWLSRYLLPGGIVLGFLLVLGWSLRGVLTSARPVTVLPVLTSKHAQQAEGTPVFQAAGWVEPRPQPVLVTALAEGVVRRIHVVENSPVKKDDPIAELIPDDADLARKAADAEVRLRAAEVASADAVWQAAKVNLERPVHLEAALAEAEAMLAQKKVEEATLPFQKTAAEARLELAKVIYESQKTAYARGALPEPEFLRGKADFEIAQQLVKEIAAKIPRVAAEVAALELKRKAQAQRLELTTDERKAEGETRALLAAAKARHELAQNALATAELRFKRMKILSPADGRVLNLVARPGTRMMGLDPTGMHEASTIVTLYDPASLQVRADVRLEDAWRIQQNQRVRIVAAAVPSRVMHGKVLFMTSQADVQKNTIQVKVTIEDPPDVLRPEMLVQVTFLAPPANGAPILSEQLRVLVPRSLVLEEAGGKSIWVADTTAGVARKKTIQLGAMLGDLVEVAGGLQLGDRLIVSGREDLRDGQRITVTGEDTTLLPASRTPAKHHEKK